MQVSSQSPKYLTRTNRANLLVKVENILESSLDLILAPSHSVKIQIMCWTVCWKCKGKTLLSIVNKLWKQKVCWQNPAMLSLITSSKLSSQLFVIWIFTKGWWDLIQATSSTLTLLKHCSYLECPLLMWHIFWAFWD